MDLSYDLDEVTQSSDTPSEGIRLHNRSYGESVMLRDQLSLNGKDAVKFQHIQNKFYECRHLLEYEKGRYTQLLGKVKKLKNENKEQQRTLGELREMKSSLDYQRVELKSYIRHLKFYLKQEKEKRMCAEILYKKNIEQLKKKEEQYSKEMEEKQRLELRVQELSHQLETESARCIQLESANRDLKEAANLKNNIYSHPMDQNKMEEFKRDTEERARQEINKTLEKVNLFLKAQATKQENLEQIRAAQITPLLNLEQRIGDLESELDKLKSSPQDSFPKNSTYFELETYKKLYSEARKMRKSLGSELDWVNEEVAEANTNFFHEPQRNSWPQWPHTFPHHDEGDCLNHFNQAEFDWVCQPGEFINPNATTTTLSSQNNLETYLTKMQWELEENTTRDLNQAFAELDAGSVRFSPASHLMDFHSI